MQLAQAHARIAIGITFVEHHLLAVVRPALRVGIGAQQLANLRVDVLHPQELHVVAGISFVDRGAENGAAVEAVHVIFDLRPCGQFFSGRVTLKNASLATVSYGPGVSIEANVRARIEGRSLFEHRQHRRRNRDDLVRHDVIAQLRHGVAEGSQQLAGGGMVLFEVRQNLLRRLGRIDLRRRFAKLLLVLAQIRDSRFPAAGRAGYRPSLRTAASWNNCRRPAGNRRSSAEADPS